MCSKLDLFERKTWDYTDIIMFYDLEIFFKAMHQDWSHHLILSVKHDILTCLNRFHDTFINTKPIPIKILFLYSYRKSTMYWCMYITRAGILMHFSFSSWDCRTMLAWSQIRNMYFWMRLRKFIFCIFRQFLILTSF